MSINITGIIGVSNINMTAAGAPPPPPQTYYSNLFDGSGDYITLGTGLSGLAFENEDFTVEAWVYRNASAFQVVFVGQSDMDSRVGSSYVFLLGTAFSNVYIGGTIYGISSPNPATGSWVHVAWVRSGTVYSSYTAGSRTGTRSDLSVNSINVGSTAFPPAIGGYGNGGGAQMNGYISNLRVVKGTAVYDPTQSNITVPTAPLTAISGTSLLTCKSSTIVDVGPSALTLTVVGDVSVSTQNPFN